MEWQNGVFAAAAFGREASRFPPIAMAQDLRRVTNPGPDQIFWRGGKLKGDINVAQWKKMGKDFLSIVGQLVMGHKWWWRSLNSVPKYGVPKYGVHKYTGVPEIWGHYCEKVN